MTSTNALSEPKSAKQKLWEVIKRALRILGIVYAAFLAMLYFQQDAMLFPRPGQRSPLPDIAGLKQASITTPDGETLPAIHLPAMSDKSTVLFFHGNGDQINTFAFLAEEFAQLGLGFASVEYRGYPGATGTISEDGIMTDGLAAFDWLKSECQCEIALMGHSLGTGVAVHVAAERDVKAVALFAPYSAIVDIAADRYWYFPVRWLIRNPINSDRRIGRVTEPVLVVHGMADTVIPIKFGEMLYKLANQPKQFEALPGIGHNGVITEGAAARMAALLAR